VCVFCCRLQNIDDNKPDALTVPCMPIDDRPLQHVIATAAALQAAQVQVHTVIRFENFDGIVSDRCEKCKRIQRQQIVRPFSSCCLDSSSSAHFL
jgi:hypothetical protein